MILSITFSASAMQIIEQRFAEKRFAEIVNPRIIRIETWFLDSLIRIRVQFNTVLSVTTQRNDDDETSWNSDATTYLDCLYVQHPLDTRPYLLSSTLSLDCIEIPSLIPSKYSRNNALIPATFVASGSCPRAVLTDVII